MMKVQYSVRLNQLPRWGKIYHPLHCRLLVGGIGRLITATQMKTDDNPTAWVQITNENQDPLPLNFIPALDEGPEALIEK